MKGYKIFRPGMRCRGMKFETGQEYKMDKAPVLCTWGFHFCVNPVDLFNYYSFSPDNIVCHVEALGCVVGGGEDSKHVTNHISIGKRIPWDEVLRLVNTGKDNTGLSNSGNRNSGSRNSGDENSGYENSGDGNSGNWNSGNWNSGNHHAGFFCTGEAKMTLFNVPTDLSFDDVINRLPCIDVSPCIWVSDDEMSDTEKAEHPEHTTTGGYLKAFTMQEAWQEWWRGASGKDRGKIMALPNFDADIFLEIAGIDVRCNR